MASQGELKLKGSEKKLFEELLQLSIDIAEDRALDVENERNPDDLYYWFLKCRDERSSSVLTDGRTMRQNTQEIDLLMLELRECMLLHKWQEAMKVLETLSKSPLCKSHYILLKVGLEIIYRLKCGSQSFDNLADFVRREATRGMEEILVDLFNFKLISRLPDGIHKTNGGSVVLDDVSELLTNVKVKTVKTKVKPKNLALIEDTSELMHGYYYPGLIAYVKWNVIRTKIDTLGNSEEDEAELQKAAEKAVRYFTECENVEGVWDVVVTKHVEILEYHAAADKNSELLVTAEKVLKDYERFYQTNPNASKMLYKFYKRNAQFFDKSSITETLVKISKLLPSDILVLELVSSDIEEVGFSRIELLFNLLDYHIWKNAAESWKLLAKLLVEGLSDIERKEQVLQRLKSCWELRKDWWPEYHFQEWTGLASEDLDLSKASVALLLLGKKCQFYRRMVHTLKDASVTAEGLELLNKARTLDLSLDS